MAKNSGLAAERYKIVHVEHVEPVDDVGAGGGEGGVQAVEVFATLGIVRAALFLPGGPGGDFRGGALVFGVGVDPGEHFGVALGQDSLKRLGINTGEVQEPLVQRAGIVIFAVDAGQGGAALVQHARQNNVAAEFYPRTPRGKFREIRLV